MKVHNKIKVHEINGPDVKSNDDFICIESHWNEERMVVIKFKEDSLAVKASELEKAIKNATNWKVY